MPSISTLIGSRILIFECIQWLLKYHPFESLKFLINLIKTSILLWNKQKIENSNRSFGINNSFNLFDEFMLKDIFNFLSCKWQTRRRTRQVCFLSLSTNLRAGGRLCGSGRSRAWCARWHQTCWASVSLISPCLIFIFNFKFYFRFVKLSKDRNTINEECRMITTSKLTLFKYLHLWEWINLKISRN